MSTNQDEGPSQSQVETKIKIQARIANQSDLRFVHSSWHTSYWRAWAHKYLTREVYELEMDGRIDSILSNPRTRTIVAFLEEVPDEVLGYSVSDGESIHWIYVKGAYRRNGIGTQLVPPKVKFFTLATDGDGRRFTKRLGLEFNPFRAY